jgi:hypothetical protein
MEEPMVPVISNPLKEPSGIMEEPMVLVAVI